MYSAYKFNKQGDSIQPWCTPFPIWNQSVLPCPILTVASWPAYRFLRRQVRWSRIPISWRIFQSFLWSTQRLSIVDEAEVDAFLEISHLFDDPADTGNLISGSSAFSKSSLYIWKFSVYVCWSLASMWNECYCEVVWTFFDIAFLCGWNRNWHFLVLWPLLCFPNLLACWLQHFYSVIF